MLLSVIYPRNFPKWWCSSSPNPDAFRNIILNRPQGSIAGDSVYTRHLFNWQTRSVNDISVARNKWYNRYCRFRYSDELLGSTKKNGEFKVFTNKIFRQNYIFLKLNGNLQWNDIAAINNPIRKWTMFETYVISSIYRAEYERLAFAYFDAMKQDVCWNF